MKLVNIMKSDVVTTFPEETAENAWKLMQVKSCHHLMVISQEGLAGVLSERDLGGKNGEIIRKDHTVADFMSTDVVTATPETSLHEAADLLRGHNIGCLPILDGNKLCGILTTTDLLKIIAGSTE